ncbi:FtsX-like permease family protein [Spongiactinospora sp. TRM90649]|uniref:FtsX-like permease family protein n=1 Tax=Spongiactinospora sp. TRM90649 TaxID=3031114 RepID=UPI0023F74B12|nr:FtsX-like permease family protein [Spongiactinospora sp. TRM90649]MDF5755463.1 hypothetical protein [Spongiactinospora sp. TRM90649]
MTIRLGLRLALRGGRESAVRLALIATAVTAGVLLLLSTLAMFNAFRTAADRPCWECTTGSAPSGWALGSTTGTVLWNYREDYYAGRLIKRLDVAMPGDRGPVPPGLPRLPRAGEFYASPALAGLLGTVPRDLLGDRFPGTKAGLVGDAALSGREDLVIMIGRSPAELAALAGTTEVGAIAAHSSADDSTALYQHGFAIAAIALIVPPLVLVGAATRLASARREARFAAIRLAGATARQINVIASVDAAVGALLGTVAGTAVFQLVRPALADVAITGSRFLPATVTPTGLQYAAVLAGIPVAAVCAALWSLRRVRISPLGVARKAAPPAPRAWRLLPLLIGLGLFAGPVFASGANEPNGPLIDLGLGLIMIGLVVAGPWLTLLAARLSARFVPGAAGLLAARRLTADPRTAFRSVTGLVLAVFVGTAIAGIVPAVISAQRSVGGGTLGDVLRTSFARPPCQEGCGQATAGGLPPRAGADLIARLTAHPGVTVLPIYGKASSPPPKRTSGPPPPPPPQVVACADLTRFAVLGRCAPGLPAVEASFRHLLSADNMLSINKRLPLVRTENPAAAAPTGLPLAAVLVRTGDSTVLERVRTLLTGYGGQAGVGELEAPMTFTEVALVREIMLDRAQRVATGIVVLTILVAACGLVVAVGGGLVERRRPFTLLRLCGTPTRTLYRVVVIESALPLVLAAALAVLAGLGVAGPVVEQLGLRNVSWALPGAGYLLTLGGGLAVTFLVILTALPPLRRFTTPDNARFE